MSYLKLAVTNSDQDVQNYRIGKQIIRITCKVCHHRWTGRIEDIDEEPSCPKCRK